MPHAFIRAFSLMDAIRDWKVKSATSVILYMWPSAVKTLASAVMSRLFTCCMIDDVSHPLFGLTAKGGLLQVRDYLSKNAVNF